MHYSRLIQLMTANFDAILRKCYEWAALDGTLGFVARSIGVSLKILILLMLFPIVLLIAGYRLVSFMAVLISRSQLVRVTVRSTDDGPKDASKSLDKVLGLLMRDPEEVETSVGDLCELRIRVAAKHGETYAKVWFAWWATWLVVKAAGGCLPGKFLLDALKSKVSNSKIDKD